MSRHGAAGYVRVCVACGGGGGGGGGAPRDVLSDHAGLRDVGEHSNNRGHRLALTDRRSDLVVRLDPILRRQWHRRNGPFSALSTLLIPAGCGLHSACVWWEGGGGRDLRGDDHRVRPDCGCSDELLDRSLDLEGFHAEQQHVGRRAAAPLHRAVWQDRAGPDIRLAVGETVILLGTPSPYSRCFNRHGEGVSGK